MAFQEDPKYTITNIETV